jgi:hypothetical protein
MRQIDCDVLPLRVALEVRLRQLFEEESGLGAKTVRKMRMGGPEEA